MAITGYFLDQEWNYCEVLLGFEHLQGMNAWEKGDVQQSSAIERWLPFGSLLSTFFCCSRTFMAITGYFLDQEWNYCEVLLGFEHLQGSHTGAHLSQKVIQILQARKYPVIAMNAWEKGDVQQSSAIERWLPFGSLLSTFFLSDGF
jgi:hypothetical protein